MDFDFTKKQTEAVEGNAYLKEFEDYKKMIRMRWELDNGNFIICFCNKEYTSDSIIGKIAFAKYGNLPSKLKGEDLIGFKGKVKFEKYLSPKDNNTYLRIVDIQKMDIKDLKVNSAHVEFDDLSDLE